MKKLSEIDKNFLTDVRIEKTDIVYYRVKENDFCLFGLGYDDLFRRMDEKTAKEINEGMHALHSNTSGGRLRFVTDSSYVVLSIKMPVGQASPHMPLTGKAGFDLYVGDRFVKMYVPPVEAGAGYEGICDFAYKKDRVITIHFPLYNNVEEVYIGLSSDAKFEKAPDFRSDKKVLFYGSSITQGACASRPGLAYTNALSHRLGFNFVNLGASGSAFGELKMADYIAGLNHDIFVMDYDNNAPTADFLEKTHDSFFRRYREERTDTPVILISAPSFHFSAAIDWPARREVIKRTYEKAIAAGDENVYYIDGEELWGENWDSCTVDGLHPNDIGFMKMADRIEKTLKPLL